MAASGHQTKFLALISKYAKLRHTYNRNMGVLDQKNSVIEQLSLVESRRQRHKKYLKIVKREAASLRTKVRKLNRRMTKKANEMKSYDCYYIRSLADLDLIVNEGVLTAEMDKKVCCASSLSAEEMEILCRTAYDVKAIQVLRM